MPCHVERQTSMYTVCIGCDCLSATSVVVSAVDVHERGLQRRRPIWRRRPAHAGDDEEWTKLMLAILSFFKHILGGIMSAENS